MDFYLIKQKRLFDARSMTEKLKFLFDNSYLNFIFNEYIMAAIDNKDTEIDYSNASELIIRKKYFSDCFHLTFIQENEVKIVLDTNNEEIVITIFFDESEKKIILEKQVTVPHKTMTSSEKTIERKTYIDNNLRYEYIHCTLEDLPPYNGELITVSETYIDLDNNAVCQKMTLTGEKNKLKEMKLEYFETNSYFALPFNNLINFNSNNSNKMIPSSREVFHEFVNGSNNLSPIL